MYFMLQFGVRFLVQHGVQFKLNCRGIFRVAFGMKGRVQCRIWYLVQFIVSY